MNHNDAFILFIVWQVNNIWRPSKYENAIKDKESAREDIEVHII